MSTEKQLTTKDFFNRDGVKKKFEELLGKRATGFITSVMQVVNSNNYLASATPESIYGAAAMAAALDLPINNSLGFAYIVPYNTSVQGDDGRWVKKVIAQFQLGWRGFVQLAQRSGQYTRINVVEVFENQFTSYNELTEELVADFSVTGSGKIVGYAAYFRLINGFEKLVFWTDEKVRRHAKRYSQSFEKKGTPWVDNFDEMAKKTVLKNTLSKWGILSIEMQQAMVYDQATGKLSDTEDVPVEDVTYHDNPDTDEPAQLETTKPSLTDDELTTAMGEIAFGNTTYEQVIAQYTVTPDQLKQLKDAAPK